MNTMGTTLLRKIRTNVKYMSYGLPNALRELSLIEKEIGKIENTILRNTAIDSLYSAREDCICYSVFETFPNVDKKNCSKFISSLVALTSYLNSLCSRKELLGSGCAEALYGSFLDAVTNTETQSNYYTKCPYKNDGGYLAFLVNRCRDSVNQLPFPGLVKDEIKEYGEKYCSFFTNTFSSKNDIYGSAMSWAEPSYNKYGLITCMEYSAGCSNLSLIFALFTEGFNKDSNSEIVSNIVNFYFPWVNSLYALMDSYICLQSNYEIDTIKINFCKRYINQKVCENRLHYFYKMVIENLDIVSNSNYHYCFIDLFISRFLTDNGAYVGINNITSRNLLKSFKQISKPSNNFYRFVKAVGSVALG